MLKFVFASAVAVPFFLFGAPPASAACVTNPAICQAICNCDCCTTQTNCGTGGGFTARTGREATAALAQFSLRQLRQEVRTIRNDPEVKAILEAEIRRRGR